MLLSIVFVSILFQIYYIDNPQNLNFSNVLDYSNIMDFLAHVIEGENKPYSIALVHSSFFFHLSKP